MAVFIVALVACGSGYNLAGNYAVLADGFKNEWLIGKDLIQLPLK